MNAATGSSSASAQGSMTLVDHLKVFFHYSSPGSLVQICNSATYLLVHAPATRQAALDYVGTFYKIAAYLHIKHNFNLRNPNNRDQADLQQNLIQINSCIEAVQTAIETILDSCKSNDAWQLRLFEWLVDLVGFISSFNSYFDPSRLTIEEVTFLKSMSIFEAIDYWKNQCKTTQNILKIIQKCFNVTDESRSLMIDMVYQASNKLGTSFDWFLCEITGLYPELTIEKCFKIGYSEYLVTPETQFKLKRTNFINFFATNFSSIVKYEIVSFLDELKNENLKIKKSVLIYLLKSASQCSALMSDLLNEILSLNSEKGREMLEFLRECLIENDHKLTYNLVECVKQLSNSFAVFDLLSNVIDWLKFSARNENVALIRPAYTVIVRIGFCKFKKFHGFSKLFFFSNVKRIHF